MPNQPKTPMRSHRIPDDEYEPVKVEAAKNGESETDVVRRALREHFEGKQ